MKWSTRLNDVKNSQPFVYILHFSPIHTQHSHCPSSLPGVWFHHYGTSFQVTVALQWSWPLDYSLEGTLNSPQIKLSNLNKHLLISTF